MIGTFRLGSLLGIPLRMHVLLVPLLLAASVLATGQEFLGTSLALWIAVLVPVLVLHELGHALAARHFGIEVLDITLWPLGGMARMSTMPESSRVEGLVALAGPTVNIALALLALPVLLWTGASHGTHGILSSTAFAFFWTNLTMGVFNLVPAFPTDGGRVLRAILGRGGDWVRATEQAVFVGRVLALAMGLVGLAVGDWMIPLLTLWLWWMSGAELAAVRARHDPSNPESNPESSAASSRASKPDSTRAARAESPLRPRGFTAADVERLERFRGRLRHFH